MIKKARNNELFNHVKQLMIRAVKKRFVDEDGY